MTDMSVLTENYGSVLRDCSKVLTLNSRSSKAYFRSATALKALERYEEALDCCDRCLAYDSDNGDIRTLRSQLAVLFDKQQERRKRKLEEERKRRLETRKLKLAFQVGLSKASVITCQRCAI